MEKRLLRVLYTVNNSPQYILARSLCPVTVSFLWPTDGQNAGGIEYASVSLKACIETLCTTSPELLQSDNRDFSVYVLDPLESESAPGRVNISNESEGTQTAEEQVLGVAVGLGLMSWALSADDEGALVNGTLTRTGSGQEALEVVLALRETTRIEKASFPAAIQSWNKKSAKAQGKQPEVDTAATIAAILNRPKKSRTTKNADALQALPESERIYRSSSVYIGPPKKKPPNSAMFGRALSTPAPASIDAPTLAAVHTDTTALSSAAKSVLLPTVSTQPTIMTSTLPTSVPSTTSSSTVKKKKTKRRNRSPDQPLFTRATPFKRTASEPLPSPNSTMPQTQSLTDIFFQLASTPANSTQNAALLATINAIDSGKGIDDNPALVRALQDLVTAWQMTPSESGRTAPFQPSNQRIPSDDGVAIDKENVNPSSFRRRVDQDVKDSKPSQTSTVPQRTNLSGHLHTDENSWPVSSVNQGNGGYISRKRTLDEFMEDRESQLERRRRPTSSNMIPFSSPPRSRLSQTEPGGSRGRPICIPDSPRAPKIAASSPVRDGTQSTARRKYVVPDWARTDTAMRPRLSEEVQRALKEAEDRKQAECEEKRRLERERRRASRAQGRQHRENTESDAPTTATNVKSSSPLRPIAAVNTGFALVSTTCEIHSVSSFLTGSRSQTPPPSQNMAPPCTPPRRRPLDSPSTPVGSSLFTPLADSWKSPLAGPSASPSYGATGKHASEDKDLSEEPESAFEELNSLPPSSLPDDDDNEAAPDMEHEPVPSNTKQFWQGLPPSSPIQSSSPLEDEDDDSDREIPIATSDAEDGGDGEDTYTDMESQPLCSTSKEAVPLPANPPAPDENGVAIPPWQDQPGVDMDMYNMFTNVDYGRSTTFAPEGLDLTEFMESMKPLIQNQLDHSSNGQGVFDFNWIHSGESELDPTQLAASVQELFSGCLM
ncbi:uncharacterized protein BT62DRAFT_1073182 [Guyanagaster necrorhizus]|uniref:Ams2/SPT21 N-terminal domain-containing protein n=1 Tax=Guyanagaster necrorhizus TaxID=856835 RepID=A0A9P8AVN8_9AGAR|nr:uncharacterized protein BT62DRAFT_1073182 [Guyanagaster necrorhizus MCA 3950]KAG7449764.1 hypothetical protein BT62DRAFT_1073182 [Guyanagaster necrorhizus MCA 3950]